MSDVAFTRTEMLPEQAPPVTSSGAIGWARQNLFSNVFDSVLTVVSIVVVYYVLVSLIPWIFSPTWIAGSLNECRGILTEAGQEGHTSGACWGVIRDRWVQLFFGFYPSDLYWRPILAFILLGVAMAPVLFSDKVPSKLLVFTALYPFIFPWLLWGGAFWGPLLVVAGFALGYLAYRVLADRTGGLTAVIAAIVVVVLWFTWGLDIVNSGINRTVGSLRMDAQSGRLNESTIELDVQIADLKQQIEAAEKTIADKLKGAEAAQDNKGESYRNLVVDLLVDRKELDRLRRKFGLVQADISAQSSLLRQIEKLPELKENLPQEKVKAGELRTALPDTVSDIASEKGMNTLQDSNRAEDLGIPPEDFAQLEEALKAEALVVTNETTITNTYAAVARVGLEPVRSRLFGGFMLSITIGVVAIACSLPLGIVLALGRQSDLLIVKYLCVGFIEFIRGVPLITLLFVASVLLNIFLPPGTQFDIILRVLIMVTLFAAAYMAEVVRGGLAALPTGQYEGADSLGLNYWQAQRLIIMPQALKISIPGIVSTFIGVFKDTTLVSIIGLLDPLGLSNAIRADSNWNGVVWELYGFIALMFWVFCFSMSRYSMYLERKLQTGH